MRLRTRIDRLAKRAAERPVQLVWLDEDEWLDHYAAWGKAGEFDHELDFATALAGYRAAVERGRASVDPPWFPPPDFDPTAYREAVRRECWRWQKFPDVGAALVWLHEMRQRLIGGIPPVTEVEYRALEAWFRANEDRLRVVEKAKPSQLLPLENGKRTVCWNIRYGLRAGPRGDGSGRLAEEMRQLRRLYPAPSEGGAPCD